MSQVSQENQKKKNGFINIKAMVAEINKYVTMDI